MDLPVAAEGAPFKPHLASSRESRAPSSLAYLGGVAGNMPHPKRASRTVGGGRCVHGMTGAVVTVGGIGRACIDGNSEVVQLREHLLRAFGDWTSSTAAADYANPGEIA